jgi:hypothetical protein
VPSAAPGASQGCLVAACYFGEGYCPIPKRVLTTSIANTRCSRWGQMGYLQGAEGGQHLGKIGVSLDPAISSKLNQRLLAPPPRVLAHLPPVHAGNKSRHSEQEERAWQSVVTNTGAFQTRTAAMHRMDNIRGKIISPLVAWMALGEATDWKMVGNPWTMNRADTPGVPRCAAGTVSQRHGQNISSLPFL